MKKTDTLKEIVARKKERLALAQQAVPVEQLKNTAASMPQARPFLPAINKPKTITLIAEIKRQSPSAGVLREDFSPAQIASVYQAAGVQAVSVLTEEDFFGGSLAFINDVKAHTTVPVLRKDFIFEPYQVYESRAAGADAVLLIADILSKDALTELVALADSLGMGCLVEAHDEKELKKILSLKIAPCGCAAVKTQSKAKKTVDFAVGINNRDLHTLEVDAKTTERLYPLVPKDRTVVVESGIRNYQDVLFFKILGVNACLVGEAIMRGADMQTTIQDLMGW